jgi:membrane-associated phospholipid phosphatase
METIRWLQQLFGGGAHGPFLALTLLGAGVVLWGLLVGYCWLVDPGFARRLGVALAASAIVNHLLKAFFGTPRPYDVDALLSTEWARRTGGGYGLPSGHAQNAATFWPALALRHRGAWSWLVALLIPLLVALSRLYLGVHMPVDVVVGLGLGALFAWAGWRWSGRWPIPLARNLWVPAVGVGCLALAYVSAADPRACGLLAGCLIARPEGVEPPGSAWRRIGIVLGGLAVLALVGVLFFWLPERISPGLSRSTPATYLRYLVLALSGFDLWPRWFQRLAGKGETGGPSVRS